MPLYRVLRTLDRKGQHIARNSIDPLSGMPDKAIKKLMDVGSIARIAPPPLTELPEWDGRARRLLIIGIMDAEQFLEANDDTLAKYLSEAVDTVRLWKAEVIQWLQPEPEDNGCCR